LSSLVVSLGLVLFSSPCPALPLLSLGVSFAYSRLGLTACIDSLLIIIFL
ncbi:hypothetical protein OG21DRAFT_1504906, partial [Imleria badia]